MDLRRLVALAVCVLVPTAATAAPQPAAAATPTATPTATPPVAAKPPATVAPAKTTRPAKPTSKPVILDWRSRLALSVRDLQTSDPALLDLLDHLMPDREVEGELFFGQKEVHDPRAAIVLLRRLLSGHDDARVRGAIVDALPLTGGAWQEGAAAMVGLDASPKVRKKLIEVMRYADAKNSLHALRLGFKDEDPDVQVAAARAAGFHPKGAELEAELYSATFDSDWDLRAAAVQALGMLRVPRSRDILIKALGDEEREVRLQALVALEAIDPDGLLELPQLKKLARDRKSHRIARMAQLLLQKRRALRKQAAGKRVTAATPPAPTSPAPAPASP